MPSSETALVQRMTAERKLRGWSPSELARRLTEVGCPTNQTSIWKIENGRPRRKVRVNELLALSRVFDIPPTELVQEPTPAKDEPHPYAPVPGCSPAAPICNVCLGLPDYYLHGEAQ